MEPLNIVWFKRDLRVTDHRPLFTAANRGAVLPLYIVEPELWQQPDASHRQWAFTIECLSELDQDLSQRGQPLVIRIGDAVEVLDEIRRRHQIAALWSHEETGNGWTYARDKRVLAWARAHSIAWHESRQFGVQRRLRSRDGWAAAWDRQMLEPLTPAPRGLAPLRPILSDHLPKGQALGLAADGCPFRQSGGRSAALSTLSGFLTTRGRGYRRDISSPLSGETGCSRLSPHLALGTVSMREVAQATWSRMRALKEDPPTPETREWRGSLASFSGRLHWHCHFIQKLESEPSIEHVELHPSTRGLRPGPADAAHLAAWCNGETGYPFLDACMRYLRATGWLNFRMRAMVTSFASYNLWLPWRDSGLHLARMFTDYEPGIHWPQIQMQSGTTGINTIRMYSVVKQGHDQDPTGAFTRRWVPELNEVPDRFLQEPWTWEGADGLIGRRYPERVVDAKATGEEAKRRIYGVRKTPAFHRAADDIQHKHGSRKSGMPMTGSRRRSPARNGRGRPRRPANPEQAELDL